MDHISVELRLYASLRKWMDVPRMRFELSSGNSVTDLLRQAGVPEDAVAIVFLNGRRAGLEATLSEGDELLLFPLLGGG